MSEDLFRDVQKVLAGHSEMAVMQALLQSLLVVIGVSAPDFARAEALINALPSELKPALAKGWVNYRLHRASMGGAERIDLAEAMVNLGQTGSDPI